MPFNYNDSKKETGVDVTLQVPSGPSGVPVTNVSFSEEADTSAVQFNNSYTQDIAVTGVSYSGSFEVTGRNQELRQAVWGTGTGPGDSPAALESETQATTLPTYLTSITIIEGDGTSYTFRNVLVTSRSKDAPADDRTSDSYDFEAEKLTVTPSGEQ